MNAKTNLLTRTALATLLALLTAIMAMPAAAASLTWDNGASTMLWNTTDANWTGSVWNNVTPDSATFGTTGAGTISLGTAITAGSVTINSGATGYIIQNNTLTLKAASAGATTLTGNETAAINSAVALNNNNQVFSVASGKTLTLGGAMSGTVTLTYGGAGTYVLDGANANSGDLTIDAASVRVNSGKTLFGYNLGWVNKTVTIKNSGLLEAYDWSNTGLWGGPASGVGDHAGNITLQTGGIFKFLGTTMNSAVNKGITVTSGTGYFRVATGNSVAWDGSNSGRDFNANASCTMIFDGGGNFTTSRYLRGAGNFTKNDGGTLKLTQNNTFTGTLTINGGILESDPTTESGTPSPIGNNTAVVVNSGGTLLFTGSRAAGFHTGTVTVNGGTITANGADLSFVSGRTITFDTAVGTFGGAGQWRRRDANNKIAVTAAASGSSISVTELNLLDNNPAFDVADGAADADLTVSSGITGSTGLVKSGGAGKLVLTGTSASFSGAVTLSAGTLQFGNGGANGSIGTGNITDNAALIFNRSGAFSVANNISGTGTMTISGSGTMTYTGAASHSGATAVNGGTLLVNGSLSSASSTVTVATGATLGGNGTIAGATTIQSGGALSPGTSIGTLTINNTVTLDAGSATMMEINKTGITLTADKLAGTGALNRDGTLIVTATGDPLAHGDTFTLFAKASYGGPGFATITLPTLPSPLLWDSSNLGVNGTITVYNPNITAVPTFSPVAGNYVGAQNVAISCATVGATIFYTTDGSTPTASSAVYSSPIAVPVPTAAYTIKAFATNSGYLDSPVGTAIYNTVTTPTWVTAADGSWANSANWQNTVIGDGADVTADFSTLDLTAAATVTLDGARTIGGLTFADTTPSHDWALNTGSGGVLTLDVTAGSPAINVANQTLAVGASVAGNDGLTKTGNGTLALNVANAYTGGTTLDAGTLRVANNSALGGVSGGTLTMNGGVFEFPGNATNYTVANPVTVTTGSNATIRATGTYPATWPNVTVSGAIANNGSLTLQGGNPASGHDQLQITGGLTGNAPIIAGHVRLLTTTCAWNANSTITLSTTNDLLELRSTSEVMPSDTTVTVNAGKFLLNGVIATMTQTIKALNGSGGTVSCDWGGNTLRIGSDDGSGSYSGTIANGAGTAPALSIVKIGTGTQTLSGANTHTGATVVSNGTLIVNGSLASGSAVTVAGGTLGGTGTISGTLTVAAAGTVAPGNSIGQLTVGGTPTLGGTLLMEVDRNGGSPLADKINFTGGVTFGGTITLTNVGAALQNGDTFDLFDGTLGGTFTTLNLPSGAGHWNTSDLNVGGTITFTNANPPAPTIGLTVNQGESVTFTFGGKHPITPDVDGDAVTVTGTGGSPTLGTKSSTAGSVTYTSTGGAGADSFTYTVADALGATATGTVNVQVLPAGNGANITGITVTLPTATVTALGVPGAIYSLQYTDSLSPVNWQDITGNVTASGTGGLTLTDPAAANPGPRYYRTKYVSGP